MKKPSTGKRTRADAPRTAPVFRADIAGETDWAAVDALTDDDIRRGIAADPDAAPELDAAWFAAAERHMPRVKGTVLLKIDQPVIDWFKAQGRGYQARMNAVLRGYVESRADAKGP